MKKTLLVSVTTSILFLFTGPATADSILHIWSCKLHDGKTPADVEAVSSAWLKAAKSMDGGEDLKVYLEYPIAANVSYGHFNFVLIAADTKTWGLFNNEYDDSPARKADDDWFEVASCSKSSIWESVEIE